MTPPPSHPIDQGTAAPESCLPPNDKNAAVLALDEISALCGDSTDWQYPGQVVRHVRQVLARARRAERTALQDVAWVHSVRAELRAARLSAIQGGWMVAVYLFAFVLLYVEVLALLLRGASFPTVAAVLVVTVGWIPPVDAIRRAVCIIRGLRND